MIEEEKVPTVNKALRARVLNEEAINEMRKPSSRETPYAIRNGALTDSLKTFDSALRYRKDGINFV